MNRGDIETRMQLTAACLIMPLPAAAGDPWINIGDLAGVKRTLGREGARVLKADKGFHRAIRNFRASVDLLYEFKLREQNRLNLRMLLQALAPTLISGIPAIVSPVAFNGVKQGASYLLIANAPALSNLRLFANVVVAAPHGDFGFGTLGTDYTIDLASGELYIVPGGNILDGDNIQVAFDNPGFTLYNDIFSALSEAGRKEGTVQLFEFDQHAAGGTPRRIHSFTGQYWCEGDDDQDGKKPSELMLKILAVDKPVVQVLK